MVAISWVITDEMESFLANRDSGWPCFYAALDSYGVESFGMLVTLTVIRVVCDYYKLKSEKVTVECDNDNSLDKCPQTTYRAKTSDKYFDLLWAVHDLRKHLRIKIAVKRVAGHQEDKKKITQFI